MNILQRERKPCSPLKPRGIKIKYFIIEQTVWLNPNRSSMPGAETINNTDLLRIYSDNITLIL